MFYSDLILKSLKKNEENGCDLKMIESKIFYDTLRKSN